MIKKIALLLSSFVTISPTLIAASCQNSNNANVDKSNDPKENKSEKTANEKDTKQN
ncbi:Hypothetical protein, predicted lipoprotein [Metamycoplasma auris 15026]|uniref:Lipoprotein n=1 Tax=Metamycoplasma auris 15026 TaxID=1188233 RepID=N9VD70_9BACT|nr:hypothetical protein [Metamycoplasma auris]ENY69361.1 Hypothetical protein, predicted lipoprotein [Metamycoplasma auris 15026]